MEDYQAHFSVVSSLLQHHRGGRYHQVTFDPFIAGVHPIATRMLLVLRYLGQGYRKHKGSMSVGWGGPLWIVEGGGGQVKRCKSKSVNSTP